MNKRNAISVSAICPIRDELENIKYVFNTLPELLYHTECIFVEGGSKDKSWEKTSKLNGRRNKHNVLFRLVKQMGTGKGEAVKTGFNYARGDLLIIVDADLSITPDDLKKVIKKLQENPGDVIVSGNRLRGVKKPKAFYWINYIGNYFFRYYYSLILNDKIKDVSCGAKAMKRTTWKKIAKLRDAEGKLDIWGDIDWLYYGRRIDARIKYVNIDYCPRLHGTSKLQNIKTRWLFAFDMFIIGIKIVYKNITHNI